MSKRIKRITLEEFIDVLKYAQAYHSQKEEPIPSLTKDSRQRIDSCLNAPFQTAFGTVIFRGLFKKAAALFYYIAKGHPLGNGNKRMACAVASFFLFRNGWWISMSDEDLIQLARDTANSHPDEKADCMTHIEAELKRCSEPVKRDIVGDSE